MTQTYELGSLIQRMDSSSSNLLAEVTSAAASAAFATTTTAIRVVCEPVAVHFMINANPTATTVDPYIPINTVEYFRVNPGDKLSALRWGGAGTANVYITEIAG